MRWLYAGAAGLALWWLFFRKAGASSPPAAAEDPEKFEPWGLEVTLSDKDQKKLASGQAGGGGVDPPAAAGKGALAGGAAGLTGSSVSQYEAVNSYDWKETFQSDAGSAGALAGAAAGVL